MVEEALPDMWIEKGRRPWLVPAIAATLCGGLAAFMFTRSGDVDALIDGTNRKAAVEKQNQPAAWDPSKPYQLQSASWDLSVPPVQSGRKRRGTHEEVHAERRGEGTPCLEVGVIHR